MCIRDRPYTKGVCQNTYPAKLTALLYERYQAFHGDKDKGLVIIPCELIDRNGDHLKDAVMKYAPLWHLGEEFVEWIQTACAFMNTLVDRIVPVSYTHLDVYKRQAFRRGGRGRDSCLL